MFRYLAFIWNEGDAGRRQTAQALLKRHSASGQDWSVALRGKGVQVRYVRAAADSSVAYQLADGGGAVLGKLFARSEEGVSTAAPQALGEADSRAMLDTNGRHLIESFWGRYVAFLHDAGAQATWVIRDPSGGVPCYLARCRGVDLYFSWIDDVIDLLDDALEVNWPYLVATVCLLREHSSGTALREITQLLAGECVQIRGAVSQRFFYWDPLAVANTDVIEDAAAAVAAMRQCVRDVVQAWASCYRHVLLSLSGGLDSSIVLACLGDALSRPQITCFHYYPLGADLDERSFARAAAAAGFLRELLLDGCLVREGIVDRAALAEVLCGRATHIAAGAGELLEYAGIEAWLRRMGCEGPPRRRLAPTATTISPTQRPSDVLPASDS